MESGWLVGDKANKSRRSWLVLFLASLYLLGMLGPVDGETRAQSAYPHHAGIVIKFGDGSVHTACVDLGDDGKATGYDVLSAAGVSLVDDVSGSSVTICKINQEGCDSSEPCFCQCLMRPGEQCIYWSYHHLKNGAWEYSVQGAGIYEVHSGDVEGWGWGVGSLNSSGSQPPVMTFDQICVPPTATPNPTATPGSTNTPLPTYTPIPSAQFWVDATEVQAGTCTTLHWITENMQSVVVDGEGVSGSGTRSLCPCQDEIHRMAVTRPDGTGDEYEVAITVKGSCGAGAQSSTATPTPSFQGNAAPTATPTALPVVAEPPRNVLTAPATTAPVPEMQEPVPADGLLQPTRVAMVLDAEVQDTAAEAPYAIPTRHELQGAVARPSKISQGQMIGYLVFGLLLMGLGGGYLFLRGRVQ